MAGTSTGAGAQAPPAAQESQSAPHASATPAPKKSHATQYNEIHTSEAAVTSAQRVLGEKYVSAVQAQDNAAMRTLIAPSTLKCFDQSKQAFLNDWIEKQYRYPVAKDHKLSVGVLPTAQSKPSRIATYPVPGTHLLGFEYASGDSTITVNQVIGEEEGSWYLIPPCPTEAGMQRFAKIQQRRAAFAARADRLAKKINEPLKSQILALIAKRDNAGAWKLCVNSLHVDFLTAQAIVSNLAGEKPD